MAGPRRRTWGTTGCFSFQVSKNLPSGEGGAVLTSDDGLAEKLYAFHNNCRARKVDSLHFAYAPTRAANFRMTEFQGALLLAQMTRLEEQAERATKTPAIWRASWRESRPGPGQDVRRLHAQRLAPVHAPLRYRPVCRIAEEQVPAGPRRRGDSVQRRLRGGAVADVPQGVVRHARRPAGVFPEVLAEWPERCRVPEYEKLCREAVWFTQSMFLGPRGDMTHSRGGAQESAATLRSWSRHSS